MNPHHPGHPGHQGHPGHPSHPAAYPHHQSLSSSPHHPGPGNAHHGYTPAGGGGPTTTPDLPSPHSPSHGAPSDSGAPYTNLTGNQGMPSNGHHHGAGGGMIGEHPHHPGHPHPHHPGHPAYPPVNHNNNNCTLKQEGGLGGSTSVQQCAGCGGRIVERWLLHALDRYWHNACLKCSCCNAALVELGSSCFTKSGMILCRTDYTRLFGSTGACAGCAQTIPASEFVMRAGGSVFHLKCFTCSKCGTQLVSGDRYCLLAGAPVCETDWHKMVKSSGVGASGNGGAPVRKGKVGRPRRSRD